MWKKAQMAKLDAFSDLEYNHQHEHQHQQQHGRSSSRMNTIKDNNCREKEKQRARALADLSPNASNSHFDGNSNSKKNNIKWDDGFETFDASNNSFRTTDNKSHNQIHPRKKLSEQKSSLKSNSGSTRNLNTRRPPPLSSLQSPTPSMHSSKSSSRHSYFSSPTGSVNFTMASSNHSHSSINNTPQLLDTNPNKADNPNKKSSENQQLSSHSLSASSFSPSNRIPPLPRLSTGLTPFKHLSSSSTNPPASPQLSLTTSLLSLSSSSSSSSPIWMNKPPRSNWNISDNKLKPIPPLHPPIPPNNMIYINDSSPSIVACRISSCLRKRSIVVDYDDEAAVATCWSKGDNGGGEGELVLFTGAGPINDIGGNNGSGSNGSVNGNGDQSEYNHYDYGTSANALAGNNYGGGGGCVVFSIHLYRGDSRGDFKKRKNTDGIATPSPMLSSSTTSTRSSSSPYPTPVAANTSKMKRFTSDSDENPSNKHNTSKNHGGSINRHDRHESLESLSYSDNSSNSDQVEYPYQDLYINGTHRSVSTSFGSPLASPCDQISSSKDSPSSDRPSSSEIPSIASSSSSPSLSPSCLSNRSSSKCNNKSSSTPDFSHGIIVECMRIRGNTIDFHKDCRAIFASARGDSDGLDDYRSPRRNLFHSPFRFHRMRMIPTSKQNFNQISDYDDEIDRYTYEEDEEDKEGEERHIQSNYISKLVKTKWKMSSSELTRTTFSALDRVLDLLEKDRLDAKLLGVKSLTLLTDTCSSGLESSYMTSLCILGSKMKFSQSGTNNGKQHFNSSRGSAGLHGNTSWTAEKLHEKVFDIAMGYFNVSSTKAHHSHDGNFDNESFVDFSNPLQLQSQSNRSSRVNVSTTSSIVKSIESQYVSTIRGYMMHVLTNALSNLIQNSSQFPLLPKPSCFEFMTKDFIAKISEDVEGATRPPMALLGTAHEAAHAAKFLHLIASYSEEGFNAVHGTYVGNGTRIRKRPIMDLLDKSYNAGLSSHHVLKVETRTTQNILRGCKG